MENVQLWLSICLPLLLSQAAAPVSYITEQVLQKRFLIIREEAVTLQTNLTTVVCVEIRDSVNVALSSLLFILFSPFQLLFQLFSNLLYPCSPLTLPSLTLHPPLLLASVSLIFPFCPVPTSPLFFKPLICHPSALCLFLFSSRVVLLLFYCAHFHIHLRLLNYCLFVRPSYLINQNCRGL